MIAVDSNVLAYLLIENRQTPDARALLARDSDWHSDVFCLVELTNVLATAMRVRRMDLSRARAALAEAHDVIQPGLHEATHFETLGIAAEFGVSAYDARYVAVARNLGVRLVTEDTRLRNAAPALTQSLAAALAAA